MVSTRQDHSQSSHLFYAAEFHAAAKKTRSKVVKAYLLGLAIELYLKAYLLDVGMTTSSLKAPKYRHNLIPILEEAERRGLSHYVRIAEKAREDLMGLAKIYPQDLRYFSLFHLLAPPLMPEIAKVQRYAEALRLALDKLIAVKG